MEKIYLATQNPGKIVEFQAMLGGDFEVLSIESLGKLHWDETGQTFLSNAKIKAEVVRSYTQSMVMADDSGLVVDSLQGAPGIYSARYGDEFKTGMQKVLDELQGVENRKARFVCSLYVIAANGEESHFEGTLEGRIAEEPEGDKGFGYDPIFIPENSNVTLAQFSRQEKNSISHRARAVQNFLRMVQG